MLIKVHKSKAFRSVFITRHLNEKKRASDSPALNIYLILYKSWRWRTLLTLQDKMFPNDEKMSNRPSLSMDFCRFLMKTFPTPLFLREGFRWHHIRRIGLPCMRSKFKVSKARSATMWRRSNVTKKEMWLGISWMIRSFYVQIFKWVLFIDSFQINKQVSIRNVTACHIFTAKKLWEYLKIYS